MRRAGEQGRKSHETQAQQYESKRERRREIRGEWQRNATQVKVDWVKGFLSSLFLVFEADVRE